MGVSSVKKARDGDGDGWIHDGTPQARFIGVNPPTFKPGQRVYEALHHSSQRGQGKHGKVIAVKPGFMGPSHGYSHKIRWDIKNSADMGKNEETLTPDELWRRNVSAEHPDINYGPSREAGHDRKDKAVRDLIASIRSAPADRKRIEDAYQDWADTDGLVAERELDAAIARYWHNVERRKREAELLGRHSQSRFNP